MNPNSVPTMYTPHVPNSSRVTYDMPESVLRIKANSKPCDYVRICVSTLVLHRLSLLMFEKRC